MKTAITVPDAIFAAAEDAAQCLGVTRSQLFTQAIPEYLAVHGHRSVTEQLSDVYADVDSQLDPVLVRMQWLSLDRDAWNAQQAPGPLGRG